nr:hypothetical protein [Tanacetum cinerariifolium]
MLRSQRVLARSVRDPHHQIPPSLSPDHPLTHTTPVLIPILCRTAHMAVYVPLVMSPGLSAGIAKVAAMSVSTFRKRTAHMAVYVPLVMSPGLSAGIAKVAAMSVSTFRKRFRSSYDSSPSPTLPVQKRGRGSCCGGQGPDLDDESYGLDDESHGVDGESYGLDDESRVPVVETAVSEPLGLGYGALRRRELALEENHVYSMFEVGHGSGSAPEPERLERVLAFRSGAVRDEIFSQIYKYRSLEHVQERTVVTFRALWRLVLALEAWAGRYDDHRLVHDMLLQQTALQRELQEMRDRLIVLELERDRKKR